MIRFVPLAAVLVCLSGCAAKLKYEQAFTLPDANHADYKQLDLDAQSSQQTVTVTVAVTGEPVDVYLVPKDKAGTFPELGPDKKTAAALGSVTNTTGQSVAVPVPAKTAYSVFVFQTKPTAKPSEVKLKLTN